MIKEKKPKRGILDGYKTYDPDENGFGNPTQWRYTFNKRFFSEYIESILEEMNLPWEILGISRNASKKEILSAYRKKAFQFHPDRGGDEEMMKKVNEAYERMK